MKERNRGYKCVATIDIYGLTDLLTVLLTTDLAVC
jgi:hypothetical protein